MASALEKLFFTITLLDKVSGPSKGVCQSFQKMQQQGKDAFQLIGKGALGLATAAAGLNTFTGPARDFAMAIGEVASLGAPAEELDILGKASMKFAMRFGGDATAIVRSAYDIQSAIPGLTNGALAAFTIQGALLAKATKADAATITSYTGTMYSIFEKDAKRIGEAKWIGQMAGKTAEAVKIFKTTGPAMAAAFSNLGSTGQIAGVSMDEQLAVLGTLQGTMGGANAGTAYKGFIAKLSAGQKELGISFKGSDGQLLPIYEILTKIRGTVGSLDKDQQIAKLTAAFGETGAQAVLNLMDKTEALKGSIGSLSTVQDSAGAAKMAEAMTDPFAKFQSTLSALRISLGQGVLPVVNLVLGVITKIMSVAVWFVNTIPGLKLAIGGVIIAITALTMAMSGFYLILGGKRLLTALWHELRIVYAWCLRNSAATHSMTLAQRLNAITQMLWTKVTGGSIFAAKLAAGAQWLYATSLKSGVFWQKLGVFYSTALSIATGRQTLQTVLAIAALSGLSLAHLGLIVKQKMLILWTGLTKTAIVGLNIAMAALKLIMFAGVVPATAAAGMGVLALKSPMLVMAAASWIAGGGLVAAATAAWAFTGALLACPVTWIVVGIAALTGGLVSLVYYWDNVCTFAVKYADYLLMLLGPIGWIVAAFRNWDKIVAVLKTVWGWFKKVCPNIAGLIEKLVAIIWSGIAGVFSFYKSIFVGIYDFTAGILRRIGDFFAGILRPIGAFFAGLWSGIIASGQKFYDWLSDKLLPLVQFFGSVFEWFASLPEKLWQGLESLLSGFDKMFGTLLSMLAKIPGLGWLDPNVSANSAPAATVSRAAALPVPDRKTEQIISTSDPVRQPEPVLGDIVEARTTDVPPGGVRNSTVNNNNRNFKVEVYAPNGLSPAQLEEFLILQGA